MKSKDNYIADFLKSTHTTIHISEPTKYIEKKRPYAKFDITLTNSNGSYTYTAWTPDIWKHPLTCSLMKAVSALNTVDYKKLYKGNFEHFAKSYGYDLFNPEVYDFAFQKWNKYLADWNALYMLFPLEEEQYFFINLKI